MSGSLAFVASPCCAVRAQCRLLSAVLLLSEPDLSLWVEGPDWLDELAVLDVMSGSSASSAVATAVSWLRAVA